MSPAMLALAAAVIFPVTSRVLLRVAAPVTPRVLPRVVAPVTPKVLCSVAAPCTSIVPSISTLSETTRSPELINMPLLAVICD